MTTKFSIGQEVWFMSNDKPTCMQVCRIDIKSEPTKYNHNEGENYGDVLEWAKPTIHYDFWDCDSPYLKELCESEVFATKEELRKAVFGE